MIVIPDPSCCEVLDFTDHIEAILRQPFVSHSSIEPLDVGVLLGLPGLDVFHADSAFLGPVHD